MSAQASSHLHSRSRLVARYGKQQVEAAEIQCEAERRSLGRPGRSVWEILEGRPQRGQNPKPQGLNLHAAGRQRAPTKGGDVLAAMLDGNGLRGAAALARATTPSLDPVTRAEVRKAAERLERLADGKVQLEFDLWGGGSVNLGHEYWDEIQRRLIATGVSPVQQAIAQAVVAQMMRRLEFGKSRVDLTASELSEIMRMEPANISRILKLLESVGAIWREPRGRIKEIHLNPEGAFRGGPGQHQAAVLAFAKMAGKDTKEPPQPAA